MSFSVKKNLSRSWEWMNEKPHPTSWQLSNKAWKKSLILVPRQYDQMREICLFVTFSILCRWTSFFKSNPSAISNCCINCQDNFQYSSQNSLLSGKRHVKHIVNQGFCHRHRLRNECPSNFRSVGGRERRPLDASLKTHGRKFESSRILALVYTLRKFRHKSPWFWRWSECRNVAWKLILLE